MRVITLSVLIMLSTTVSAGDKGRSVMFQDNDEDIRHLTSLPKVEDAEASRCTEMVRKLEKLKGKPQRRYALRQRYELECLDRGSSVENN